MNTTVETMKDYILSEYKIEFKIVHYNENKNKRYLEYKKNKEKYTLSCWYASHPEIDGKEYWSIYYDYMNYKDWYGYGGTYIDEGNKTIDKIMEMWKFDKNKQTNIFDFIGSD